AHVGISGGIVELHVWAQRHKVDAPLQPERSRLSLEECPIVPADDQNSKASVLDLPNSIEEAQESLFSPVVANEQETEVAVGKPHVLPGSQPMTRPDRR